MILTIGVFAGLLVGIFVSQVKKEAYQVSTLRGWWLVFLAVIPQLLVFKIPLTGRNTPDALASIILVGTQTLLLIFCLLNFQQPAFWFLAFGLGLNLIVIIANQGLMPIDPQHVRWLVPDAPEGAWAIGERLGYGKDIVLNSSMKLGYLSDRFRLAIFNYKVVYSIGDVFVALGAFLYSSNILPQKVFRPQNEMEQAHA